MAMLPLGLIVELFKNLNLKLALQRSLRFLSQSLKELRIAYHY